MEDRPHIAFRRRLKEAGPLWGVIIVSACVRFYYSYHPLISDEVFNLVTIERLAEGEGYSEYFFHHPPLYIFISFLVSYVIGSYPRIPSYISIIFSVLSLIPLYRITVHLFGKKTAFWASVFLSVMPANIAYSSWIKQDAMLLFFFLVGLVFYLKERYFLSGAAIGVALLVKEFAIFFFPLTFLITAFAKREEGSDRLKFKWVGWLKMTVVAFIISSWWYILFGTAFYQVTGDALIGGNIRELGWHFPAWFYIKNVPYDLSYPIIILSIIGVVFLIKEIYHHSIFSKYMIPILWILVFYLPLSFITVKTPWYIYLAMPTLAIVAGFGIVELINFVQLKVDGLVKSHLLTAETHRHRGKLFDSNMFFSASQRLSGRFLVFTNSSKSIRLLLYFGLIVSLMLAMYSFDNVSFIKRVSGITGLEDFKKIQGKNWDEMLEKKKFWSQAISGKGKVAFLEFRPILSYLIDIRSDNMVILKVSQFLAFNRIELLDFTRDNGIGAFVINSESLTYTKEKLRDMISLWGEPENIDSLLVFKTGH